MKNSLSHVEGDCFSVIQNYKFHTYAFLNDLDKNDILCPSGRRSRFYLH